MLMPIRNLIIWAVIALLLVGLFTFVNPAGQQRNQEEKSYSQLMTDVKAGKVKSVEMQGDQVFTKTIDAPAKTFFTYVPLQALDFTQRLEAAGVQIKVRPARSGPTRVTVPSRTPRLAELRPGTSCL